MASKNPLANPQGSGGAKGRDMVASPSGLSGKGTDFVSSQGESKQGKPRGKDFVDQSREQPVSSPAQRANPSSVPAGGSNAAEALNSQLAPGNGGSAGPQGRKPFTLKGA
jgi:hypothetical protein